MPRQKKIVMEGLTLEERRAAVLKKAVEVHQPYKVFKSPVRSQGWVLVYDDPRTLAREMVMENIVDKRTANDLREMVEAAWARGYMASTAD